MAKIVSFNKYYTTPVALQKGVNENVGSLELEPGELIDCSNYMIAAGGYGGYTSTAGYERMDGAVTPSQFPSYLLTLVNCSVDVLEGETITGDTTGATAIALGDAVVTEGALLDGDATLVIEALIGTSTLEEGETVTTPSGTIGTVKYPAILYGGNNDHHLAMEYARDLVQEVPGEGDILGLHVFESKIYAFRKKTTVDEVGMYVEDSAGWLEVDTTAAVITYSSSGHNFKFSNYNFGYDAASFSMYWVDGVNNCMAYDGTTVIKIPNASIIGTDAPELLATHNQLLFLTYPGGYLMANGAPGLPLDWTAPVEYGVGGEITNLIAGVSNSLIILLEEGIQVLSGTSELDFTMKVFSTQSGAYLNTAQRLLGTVFFIDDRGVTTLEAVDAYGDYASSSISDRFKKTLQDPIRKITNTSVSRDLNQYRIHFDDGTSIYVSFEAREQRGATFMIFPDSIDQIATGDYEDNRQVAIFSSPGSGYVYRMDSGPNFDGQPITATLKTAFHHYGSPRNYKAFKRLTCEIRGEAGQEFLVRGNLDYSELGTAQNIWNGVATVDTISNTSSLWGKAIYGTFIWGAGAVTNRVITYLVGIGTNIGFNLVSKETYRGQHIIQNFIVDYELMQRRI